MLFCPCLEKLTSGLLTSGLLVGSHIERNNLLLYVADASSVEIHEQIDGLLEEKSGDWE